MNESESICLANFPSSIPVSEIEIVFEATHHPIEKLLAGELDLAITSNPEHPEQIEFIQLFSDEMLAVVSDQHPWAKREYVVSEDFQDVTLIIHSLPLDTVSIFRTQLTPKGLHPKKLIILPLTKASIELVKANMGVIVLANWAMKPYINGQVKAVRINPDGFFRQQYIARMRNRKYPVYFDYFIRFLREELRINAETETLQ